MRHAYVTTGSTQPRIKSLSAAAATLAWPFVTACPDLTRSEAPAAPYTLISRREIAFRTVRASASVWCLSRRPPCVSDGPVTAEDVLCMMQLAPPPALAIAGRAAPRRATVKLATGGC